MEPKNELPTSVSAALLAEPLWLQAWLVVLGIAVFAALAFVLTRGPDGLSVRREPLAILISFALGGALMEWMFTHVGYVRLLGLAHLVTWGPVWFWLLSRRREIGTASLYGRYVHVYLGIAGICLILDAIDVVRHFFGNTDLVGRLG